MKLQLFGTAGIRGKTMKFITPNMAEKLARAYAQIITPPGTVVIGRDTRYGAEILEYASIAGLTGCGLDVVRCGIVPTPVLCAYQQRIGANGAVMITGSHIPPDRIGLIYIDEIGAYFNDEKAARMESIFLQLQEREGYTHNLPALGKIKSVKDSFIVYSALIAEKVNWRIIEKKRFKVLLDSANGTAAGFVHRWLHDHRCLVSAINDVYDPVPNRLSEPSEENLKTALEIVENTDVDVGVAFDVDADRIMFMTKLDGKAKRVSPNIIGAILLERVMEGQSGDVIIPINTSGIIEEILDKYGKKPVYCRIGQPATIDMCRKQKSVIAYEESGKYYFIYDNIWWPDGPLTLVKILEVLAEEEVSLAELIKRYPKYITRTINVKYNEASISNKSELIAEIYRRWKELRPQANILDESTLDGYKTSYNDRSWVLIRPSGTEPKIRIVADGKTTSRVEKLVMLGKKVVEEVLEDKLKLQTI